MKLTMRILYVFLLWSAVIYAQSSPVSIITAPSGSTLANCGTPTAPSICVVTPGVYVWQSATLGWQLIGATTTSGVTSWNGLTGVVTYAAPAAPVSSVNGKTGAVTIAASSTTTTTLQ